VTKPELRKAIRVRLQALSLEALAEKSAAICLAVTRTPEWHNARVAGFFSPLPSEPNIDLLWAVLGERAVCYPRIHGDDLIFICVPSREALLESSRWNLMEPMHRDEHVVPIEDIDLLFVPGVAFTADGHRMGRGKGYYDRLLANPAFRSPAFGVCFAEQIVSHLPMEDHDRPVSRVFSV
jgi:5-formyltetrahydrofolate cyclo-ligase